jgi:hypothetical protein
MGQKVGGFALVGFHLGLLKIQFNLVCLQLMQQFEAIGGSIRIAGQPV